MLYSNNVQVQVQLPIYYIPAENACSKFKTFQNPAIYYLTSLWKLSHNSYLFPVFPNIKKMKIAGLWKSSPQNNPF